MELIISRLLQLIIACRDIIFLSTREIRYDKLRMTLMKVFRQGIGRTNLHSNANNDEC